MRKRSSVLAVVILLSLCIVGVAFAQFSTNIEITGSAAAAGSFDVVFAQNDAGGVQHTVYTTDGIEVEVAVVDSDTISIVADEFGKDGSSVVITLTVKNVGTVAAQINDSDIYINVPDNVAEHFSVTASVIDSLIQPGATGEISVTVTCTDHEPLLTFSGVSVTLGYHQQTVGAAPDVSHAHN